MRRLISNYICVWITAESLPFMSEVPVNKVKLNMYIAVNILKVLQLTWQD